jgi:hypothetical protein
MTLFFLDRRSQLAILLAASVTQVVVPACGGRPGPGPTEDAGADVHVSDPMPIDAQADYHVSDPMPTDAHSDPQFDPPPPDAQADYHVSDPMPWDLAPGQPTPRTETRPIAEVPVPVRADDLPLSRALNVRIARLGVTDGAVRLRAVPTYAGPRLSFVWTASAGTLSSTTAGEVLWTPPAGPGRHLVQVAVRDGERALAVDAIVEVR